MTDADAAAHFRALADRVVDDVLATDPEAATHLGDHRYDDQLTDRSDAAQRRHAARAREHLAALAAIDVAALDPEDAVDHAMLVTGLERHVHAVEAVAEHRWNPLVFTVGEALYPLLARAERPAADRLRALAARLDAVPDVVALAREQLADCPAVHVETAVGQNAGALAMLDAELPPLLDAEPSLRPRVDRALAAARDALTSYGEWLRDLAPRADGEFRLGEERFARKLALTLDAGLDADAIVARARDNLAAVQEQLYALARDAFGEAAAADADGRRAAVARMLDRIADAHPDDATIVARCESAMRDATAFVAAHDLVTLVDEPMEIQLMPEFRRGVAVAYCDAPGPLEDGGVTFFAVAPTPDGWPAERKTSFWREYNDALVVDLTVHEAMPGHMLQLAHARAFTGSTRVRQVFRSGSFVEGWAVHAERLMAERGHGGPAVRAQQLKMQLRMSINTILDHGVHAAGMTEDEALRLMTVDGFQEEGEAVGKWRRACLTSAQLSTYFVGYVELADLLARRPAGWTDRQVHDALLAHGNPSPRRLAQLLGW